MKRIRITLSLEAVAPLLDVVKAAADSLRTRLAAPQRPPDGDPEFGDAWTRELLVSQNSEVRELLGLFDREFFDSGVIWIDAEGAEGLLRACAALRLQLRAAFLPGVSDESLESGEVDFPGLGREVRQAFMTYIFLATLQEVILQHLDESAAGDRA